MRLLSICYLCLNTARLHAILSLRHSNLGLLPYLLGHSGPWYNITRPVGPGAVRYAAVDTLHDRYIGVQLVVVVSPLSFYIYEAKPAFEHLPLERV